MQYKDNKFGVPVELMAWVLPILFALLFAFLVSVLHPTIRKMVYGRPPTPPAASTPQHGEEGKPAVKIGD